MLQGEDIVCFSTADWDTPLPTNKHHLMARLARHNRVLYIETLGTRAPRIHSVDLKRIIRRLRRGLSSVREVSNNLYLLSPLVIPSFRNYPFIFFNNLLFRRKLKKTLKRLEIKNPIYWVYNPYAVHFIKGMPRKLLVYHCVDDLSLVPGAQASGLGRAEVQLLRESDIVFASAKNLANNCLSYNKDTIYQPNVADYDHFSKAAKDDYPIAEELRDLRKPIALFSGNLAPHKVDFKLIDFLCGKRLDWNIVLVGPLWEGFSKKGLEWLRRMPNLKFTGHVSYKLLPSYLKAADVLIIPYLVNDVTSNVFPIKFFEYLAAGKPVVATALPSLADYKEHVKLCDTYQGFAMGVREALKSDNEERRKRRMEIARQNTWEERIAEMSEHIERKIK